MIPFNFYKTIFFAVILFSSNRCFSQEYNDSLYLHLYNYQVIKGELEEGLDLNELNSRFNIEELVNNTNTEQFSVFKFYHLEYEEPLTSFLILEKDNVEIYDILSFDVLIEKILDSPIRSVEIKKIWIKEVLKLLRSYYEVVDMERIVVEKSYGNYHYYIPVINLKNKVGVIK